MVTRRLSKNREALMPVVFGWLIIQNYHSPSHSFSSLISLSLNYLIFFAMAKNIKF